MKILVLKRDKLGDALLTTPLLRVLREHFPAARVDVLASDYNAWVIQGNRHVSNVYAYSRVRIGTRFAPWNVIVQVVQLAGLRRRGYDVVLAAQGEYSPRALRRALWIKGRRTISYVADESSARGKLSDPLPAPQKGHEAQRMLNLLAPLGITGSLPEQAPEFSPPAESIETARSWLRARGVQPFQFAVVGLGARLPRKQPTASQVIRWSHHLREAFGLLTVLVWTPGGPGNALYPGDDALASEIISAGVPGLLAFRSPLQDALGLIWLARVNVFPDSGLMHFASAAPGGVVGLFGDSPEFAAAWHPLGPKSTYLVAPAVKEIHDQDLYDAMSVQLLRRT